MQVNVRAFFGESTFFDLIKNLEDSTRNFYLHYL